MSTPTGACNAATFAPPSVVGAEILSIQATQVSDFSAFVPEGFRFTSPDVELQDANFCNVTVSYTHPGQDDHIIVEAWLPSEGWNGRMQALGGGGWAAGRFELTYAGMQGALADGFATITTDAGLGDAQDVSPWALLSPGNVNLYSLQNLASVSLNDEVSAAAASSNKYLSRDCRLRVFLGLDRQVTHRELLRPSARLLLLEWVLSGRQAGAHAGAAISHGVRWDICCCSGYLLVRTLLHRPLAPADHERDQ